ncbi:hypothetical protein [Deinococcus sp. QL22]|uniref:glycine-rich domain-containing protein n=1 Tax=Deinococcus sp. QL22 TaxID=2939437 RepID=UPI0020180107|nr:hypothetical protein [Deinococcus sp. QL22]UQN06823.1 hypothetical protein M1R55_02550 [Deinococcus sp. QL22]
MHTLPTLGRHGTVSPSTTSDTHSSPLTSALLNYTFPTALIDRLQVEHRWTPALTLRALEEYRRFLVLAATGGVPVTPSKLIDEVWHLHLTFTRDYWERLTPLLPAPLHHEPASGQPGDAAHYANQYLSTLNLYAETFGSQPPADLWPDPNCKSAPKREFPTRWLIPLAASLIAWATFAWSSFAVLIALAVLVMVGIALAGNSAPTPRKDRNSDGGSGGSTSSDTGGDSCDSGGGDGGGGGCGGGCGS